MRLNTLNSGWVNLACFFFSAALALMQTFGVMPTHSNHRQLYVAGNYFAAGLNLALFFVIRRTRGSR